jgi:hypothetical protein
VKFSLESQKRKALFLILAWLQAGQHLALAQSPSEASSGSAKADSASSDGSAFPGGGIADIDEVFIGTLSLPKLGPNEKRELIGGLTFENGQSVVLRWENVDTDNPVQIAKIIGKMPNSFGKILTAPDYPNGMVRDPVNREQGLFTLRLPVNFERTVISFRAVDATGKEENQPVVLNFARIRKTAFSPWAGTKPTLEVGAMSFNYIEKYLKNPLSFNQSEILPTFKGSYNFVRKRWNMGFSGLLATVPLTNNITSSGNSSLLSLEAKAGYIFPKELKSWRLNVSLGLYFTTMFVDTNYFGYKGAIGPQLGAQFQQILWGSNTGYVYLKLTPMPASGISFNLTNREYDIGLGLVRPLSNQHPLTINFELADFLATVGANYNNIRDTHTLHSTSLGLSLGYGF